MHSNPSACKKKINNLRRGGVDRNIGKTRLITITV
jgi:hypothetical protein